MEQTFYEDGILMISWIDEAGNTWKAEYEAVKWFGKECFEKMPYGDDAWCSWEVTFNYND